MQCKVPHWVQLDREQPEYPALLRQIADPPPRLYACGRLELLERARKLAIVGSRAPSWQRSRDSQELAAALSRAGVTVVSGLARGIDAAAHRGALQAWDKDHEAGSTIAVLGTGLDRVYPPEHAQLQCEIANAGLLLTEFPPGSPPRPGHFPRRNRIISGLCQGVLVTAAAQRSGSLITARLAAEQGRDVLALPGSIHDPLARGCHLLLRDGAALVETVADIGAALGWPLADTPAPAPAPADPQAARLLAAMGWDPVLPEQLVGRCALPPRALQRLLLELELQGWIGRAAGGRVQRRKPSSQG